MATSQCQRDANRRNSRSSTGPRTFGGKKRASQNAVRHGLNTKPSAGAILSWYRTILCDPSAEPDPLNANLVTTAALDLASAEAHLEAVRSKDDDLLHAFQKHIIDDDRYFDAALVLAIRDVDDATALKFIKLKADLLAAEREERRIIARYRAEAEARRQKSLQQYIEACEKAFPETNPID